jgi:hypothetical protein
MTTDTALGVTKLVVEDKSGSLIALESPNLVLIFQETLQTIRYIVSYYPSYPYHPSSIYRIDR